MRISDWSSDVCSSDLLVLYGLRRAAGHAAEDFRFQQLVAALQRHHQNIVLDRAEQSAQILVVHLDEIIEDEHLFLDRLGDGLVPFADLLDDALFIRSEEHTSELQSLMRISYAVFCLKKQ